jgi:hypothetical protein
MLSRKTNDIPSGLFSGLPEDYNHSIPLGLSSVVLTLYWVSELMDAKNWRKSRQFGYDYWTEAD